MRLIFGLALFALGAGNAAAQTIQWPIPGRTWERIGSSPYYRAPDPGTGIEAGREVDRENEELQDPRSRPAPDLPVGASVLARNGDALGSLIGLVQAEDTGLWYGVIRDGEGGLRAVESDTFRPGPDGQLLTNLTEYQFRRLRSVSQGG
ncbi:hypothetical protein [Brevundimonas sp.]|uniref:hypothetical protein n=1 Tax=Brevundimonas sp. TaxID=1871086 RepID=UPI0025E2C437|nr:hypothetical protein [Brevundimonas sp.]